MKIVTLDDSDAVAPLVKRLVREISGTETQLFVFNDIPEAVGFIGNEGADLFFCAVAQADMQIECIKKVVGLQPDLLKRTFLFVTIESAETTRILKEHGIRYVFETPIDLQRLHRCVERELQRARVNDEKYSRIIQRQFDLIDRHIIMSQTDLKGRIVYVSRAFCEISGYRKEELIGRPHHIVRHPDMSSELFREMWETIRSARTWKGDIKNLRKDGSFYWVDSTISPNYDDEGRVNGYTSIRIDITDRKKVEELSITDPLTGVYNRRHFNTIFMQLLNRARRDTKTFCFIMLDVDHFKQYNDTYGHQKGDEALVRISDVIKEHLKRADDHLFRLGGEEFGIICEGKNDTECVALADHIGKVVENLGIEHRHNSASPHVTVSLGLLCLKPSEEDTLETIYLQADDLLYRAKENGRNRTESNITIQ